MADQQQRYEYKTVRVLRGREAATLGKWESQGWELDSRHQGRLRSEMTLRRPKPSPRWGLIAVLGALGLLVVGLGVGALLLLGFGPESEPQSAPPSDAPTQPRPVEPTSEVASESVDATPTPTPTPTPTAPPTSAYTYKGPRYDVVLVDKNVGLAKLDSYWVVTDQPDYSGDAYQDDVKAIIDDLAVSEGSATFVANVVTDERIARAESPSTYQAFIRRYGQDYATRQVPALEKAGWVATYTGGVNPNSGMASDADSAFEILYRPYATSETETWSPTTVP